ncbi:11089_t:CDS:1, partial [Dentiscutata erythropus]
QLMYSLKDSTHLSGYQNNMINRHGKKWKFIEVPDDKQEFIISLEGHEFNVTRFNGPAKFETDGWHGWENWCFA